MNKRDKEEHTGVVKIIDPLAYTDKNVYFISIMNYIDLLMVCVHGSTHALAGPTTSPFRLLLLEEKA